MNYQFVESSGVIFSKFGSTGRTVFSTVELIFIKVGLNLKFDYKMQFLFLEKSETSGIEESHDMSF